MIVLFGCIVLLVAETLLAAGVVAALVVATMTACAAASVRDAMPAIWAAVALLVLMGVCVALIRESAAANTHIVSLGGPS